MSLRNLAMVLFLGIALGAPPTLRAEEASDKFVGAWKTKAKFTGYDQLLTIAKDGGGQWSVRGSFEKDGAVVGAFLGEKVRLAGDSLSYLSKFTKKPVESWQDNDTTLRLDGDALVMSFTAKTGDKIMRTFARMQGEPKVVAKTPAPEPAKDKTPASEPFKNMLQATVAAKLVGTWKASGRFDEYWTVAPEGGGFKVTGAFWKNGKEVGSAHGVEVAYGKDNITFRRLFDKKPDPKLGNSTICILKATESAVEFIVGGGFKAKGEAFVRAEASKVVAQEAGKPADTKPKAGGFLGFWTGAFPDATEQLILSISTTKDSWIIEGYVLSGDDKRLAYFKPFSAKTDNDGASLTITPTWVEKAPPVTSATSLTLTSQPKALRAELSEPNVAGKVVVELTKGDRKMYAQLKPPALPKGKAAAPSPGVKTLPGEIFKLPRDVAPAKPFAVLDAKLRLVAAAVSPKGQRVALGSKQTLDGMGFTADLSVWDIDQKKQVWIKKKIVAEKDLGMIRAVAFSGDGKILAAVPHKADGEDVVQFFDADTGVELRSPALLKIRVDSLAFHPTKRLLAIGTGGRLGLINLSTGKTIWTTPQVHKVSTNGLAFSPGGETIATYGWTVDGKGYCVKLFDVAKGTQMHDFGATKQGLATAVVFSGDGQRLAAFIGDQGNPGITIWDVASKEPIRRISGVVPAVTLRRCSLAFLPDNKTLAAGCADYHLHLFDVTTGQRVGVFPRTFRIGVSDVFVVADGQMLLTNVEAEGLVQLWKLSDALPPPSR